MNSILRHFKRKILAGSLLLIPVAVTYVIMVFAYGVVNDVLRPAIEASFAFFGKEDWSFPGIGVITAVALIYMAGLLIAWNMVVRMGNQIRKTIQRTPVVGMIYSSARQLIQSFSDKKTTGFQRVVMIQYPRIGYWAVGFLTSVFNSDSGDQLAVVYIPTAPLPNSGWLAIVPFEEVHDTDISTQDAMQFVFSGGIVIPEMIKSKKAT
jgi:uncharacterized membrane protein